MKIINEKTIEADEGMVLTNGTAFGVIVYLGKNDSIDNWHEITEEDKTRLEALWNTETPTEPTTEEKAQAYDILMGVSE